MGRVIVRGEEARLHACEIVRNGGTLDDAALATEFGRDYVRQLCKQRGIEYQKKQRIYKHVVKIKPPKKPRMPRLDHDAIRRYYAEGHTAKETAQKFGASKDHVKFLCKGIRSGNQYQNGMVDIEAHVIKSLEEHAPNFEYIGGYTTSDGFVDVKCKICGTVLHKSWVTIRHGHVTCEGCMNLERAEKERQRQLQKLQKQKEQEERERARWIKASCNQLSMSVCECCGSLFVSSGRMKYCSTTCSKRINNAIKKDRRIRKIRHMVVDKNITLERLYERDNGRCYICGNVCDWDDYAIEQGVFIAYNNYPSIDHIVPLSKGGKHAWNNVKLACRGCNSRKSDNLHLPYPAS